MPKLCKSKRYKQDTGEKFGIHTVPYSTRTPALPAELDREAIAAYMRQPPRRSIFPDDYIPPGTYDLEFDELFKVRERGTADAKKRK